MSQRNSLHRRWDLEQMEEQWSELLRKDFRRTLWLCRKIILLETWFYASWTCFWFFKKNKSNRTSRNAFWLWRLWSTGTGTREAVGSPSWGLQNPWHGGTALGVPAGTGIGPVVFQPQYSDIEWAFPCVTHSLVLWDARQWQSAGGTKGLTAVLGCWVLLWLSSCPEVEKQNDSAGPQHQIVACEWDKTRWHGASFQVCGSHQAVGTWMQLMGKAVEKWQHWAAAAELQGFTLHKWSLQGQECGTEGLTRYHAFLL